MKNLANLILLTITALVLGSALLLAARLGDRGPAVDESALGAANRLFEAGRYVESARVLEQILAQGTEDSAVYFNLGNAFYAQGDLARALESYEAAASLAPRDEDIRHNLDLVRAQAADPAPEAGSSPVQSLSRLTESWLTLDETALLLLGLWFLACFLVFASRLTSRSRLRSAFMITAALGVALLLLVSASLGSRVYLDRSVFEKVDLPTVVAAQDKTSGNPGLPPARSPF